MRFLHLVPRYYPYVGGSELYVQQISEHLASRGHEVTVLTTNAWDLEYFWNPSRRHLPSGVLSHNGVTVVRLPVHHLPLPHFTHRALHRLTLELARLKMPKGITACLSQWWVRVPQLIVWLRQKGLAFDLVHTNSVPFDTFLLAPLDALGDQRPVICTPHTHFGTFEDRSPTYYTMPHQLAALNQCSRVVAQTPYEAQMLSRLGVDPERIRLGGVGVRAELVTGGDPQRFRTNFGLKGPIVGYLGTAAFEKGAIHLLQAVRCLWGKGMEVNLVYAGPTLSDFEKVASRISDRRLKVLGFVDHATKRDFLAAIDLLAMPSRTEAFGIVYLEAWANGKPVIGARAGAVSTVIRHGVDGFLVDFGDIHQLALCLEALLQSPDLRRSLGNHGRERVLREFSWEHVFTRLRAIYAEATGVPEEAI